MPQIKVIKPFAFAHRGVEVEEFQPADEPREVSEEVANHAGLVEEGFIQIVGDEAEAEATTKPARKKATE